MDRSEFYRPPADLDHSAHPVTWLRIKLLAKRATAAGYVDVARRAVDDWDTIARTMGVTEDYHGFYTEAMAGTLTRTIDDMLVEAAPRACRADEAAGGSWSPAADSLIRLLNWAWQVYEEQPDTYHAWEADQIRSLLP
jgi:hypothetical protein